METTLFYDCKEIFLVIKRLVLDKAWVFKSILGSDISISNEKSEISLFLI